MISSAQDGSVRLRGLSKTFSNTPGHPAVQALKALDLDIPNGEFLVLVGPSGSGKTTLLRLLAGLETVTQGTIEIGGQVVNDVHPKDRGLAMVFQNFALYPHMSAFENMAFGLRLAKKSKAEIRETVLRTAASLGLDQVLDRLPQALSGGQRQRVALGRAIVRHPRVFLFDEPLSNLDAPMRVQMRAEIARLHAQLRTTMIYVTHDQAEAMTLGDRVCVLHEGALMQVAEPLTLYRHPANLFVAGFIGNPPMNLLHGRVQRVGDALCFVQNGATTRLSIPLPGPAQKLAQTRLEKPMVLGLRPEHFCTVNSDTSPPIATGVIEFVEQTGPECILHLKMGDTNLAARVYGEHSWKSGDPFPLRIQTEHAHWFDPETGTRLS